MQDNHLSIYKYFYLRLLIMKREMSSILVDFTELKNAIEGDLLTDELSRIIYATDASVYKESPIAVALPRHTQDVIEIVKFAAKNHLSLIPRAGGTSLSGQCVGNGIVVDVSKYMTDIISVDAVNKLVTVQPGVIRDDLNRFLLKDNLFFPPITSTSNRANVGGMVGNNSCGQNSIVYGDTRQYAIRIEGILSDGSEVVFENIAQDAFQSKLKLQSLEGELYRQIHEQLSLDSIQENIRREFPKESVSRRNTGYALDEMIKCKPFTSEGENFNFCKLICGSEGTLAFITEITFALKPLSPSFPAIAILQFGSIRECLESVTDVMELSPFTCEMMDKPILDCTKGNAIYNASRQKFIEGDPVGVLMVEFRAMDSKQAHSLAQRCIDHAKSKDKGYSYSIVEGEETKEVWKLRKAGLGLLANLPGDPKAVACIEDTAVSTEDLADYIQEFDGLMKAFDQEVIHYAHAGAGELHLRPILDLKKKEDRKDFYDISLASAQLVKKYQGSLSGEHGDGRVRAPFIELMVGKENYSLFKSIKYTWDPKNIFNPNKIIDAKPMTDDLRYEEDQYTPAIDTLMDFSDTGGILRLAEKCNGSGDCRKKAESGGVMCPSYHATLDEKNTTRARANTLRTLLTENKEPSAFDHEELKEVMDLCLSCKGCTSECPSNVDMTNLKAEFTFQYQKKNGIPLRSRAFAYINSLNAIGSIIPSVANFILGNNLSGSGLKKILGVAPNRSLPTIQKISLRKWYRKYYKPSKITKKKTIYLFCDEFTNYNDTHIGIKTIQLFSGLGYKVNLVNHDESGRAAFSKGLLEKAKKHAEKNVNVFSPIVNEDNVLIGIEPSAILGFRDEYPKIVSPELVEKSKVLAKNVFLIEEFIAQEIRTFSIATNDFDSEKRNLVVHAHCHQKALSNTSDVFTALSIAEGHTVTILDTGCCGMAGSFGYEKEHYKVSMDVGELVLFPKVREASNDAVIVASGTSCRHQIMDGTKREGIHPVEVLFDALKS